jgi:hypothetical protein
VRSLSAAIPLLLAQEAWYRSGTFSLRIVKGFHFHTATEAIDFSIRKTGQSRPLIYNISPTRNVENLATVEIGYLKHQKKAPVHRY